LVIFSTRVIKYDNYIFMNLIGAIIVFEKIAER
jgi:hypothetical protein